MKKATDEQIAKLAGWEDVVDYGQGCVGIRPGTDGEEPIPAFTTSLDAITALIEGEGLDYTVSNTQQANVRHAKRCFALVDREGRQGDTAPLALCAAYAAYKESQARASKRRGK